MRSGLSTRKNWENPPFDFGKGLVKRGKDSYNIC